MKKNNNKKGARSASLQKKTGKNKKKKTMSVGGRSMKLSPCASDYAFSLRDPFDGPLACVPSSYPPIPTFKCRVFARGNGSCGTNGFGFVMANPRRCAANDIGGVYYSLPAYVGLGFPATTASTGVQTVNSNSPFNYASFGTGTPTSSTAQYRIVAMGVRSWYSGTNLNLSGETVGFRHPDNDSVLGLLYSDLLGFDSARRTTHTDSRPSTETLWIPTKPGDLEFQGTIDDVVPVGHIVTGVAATTFAWEVFLLYEFIGRDVQGKSMSHADPAGFAAVLTAAQSEGDTWVGSARQAGAHLVSMASQGLSSLSGVIGGAARQALPYVARAGANAGMAYLMGNPGGIGSLDPGRNLLEGARVGPTIEEVDVIDELPRESAAPNPTRYMSVDQVLEIVNAQLAAAGRPAIVPVEFES